MRKMVNVEIPDGTTHNMMVTHADITNDGKIVLSCYDLNNSMHVALIEIMKENGEYYRNPKQRELAEYVRNFQAFDKGFSEAVVNALPDKLEIYNEEKVKAKESEKETIVKENRNSKTYTITAVMYANRGEALVVYDGLTTHKPLFFTAPSLSGEEEVYKRFDIDPEVQKELIRKIEIRLGEVIDLSMIPSDRKFELSSGDKYFITFASCDDENLFKQVASSCELKTDATRNIESDLYLDRLSLALHHELPLELSLNGKTIRYETNSSVARKVI